MKHLIICSLVVFLGASLFAAAPPTPTPTPFAPSQVGKQKIITCGMSAATAANVTVRDAVTGGTNNLEAVWGDSDGQRLLGIVTQVWTQGSANYCAVQISGVASAKLGSATTAWPELAEAVLVGASGYLIDADVPDVTEAAKMKGTVISIDTTAETCELLLD